MSLLRFDGQSRHAPRPDAWWIVEETPDGSRSRHVAGPYLQRWLADRALPAWQESPETPDAEYYVTSRCPEDPA